MLSPELITQINETLNNDGVIAFVTDTVWGIGCLPSSEKAVKKIYDILFRMTRSSPPIHTGLQ